MHPFVLGELACGYLRNRGEILKLLAALPMASNVTELEALEFIEQHELMGRGIGYIDVHLLASTALDGTAKIWTRDRQLATVAKELKLVYLNAK
jgi:predicted nucleic acid-binding protein